MWILILRHWGLLSRRHVAGRSQAKFEVAKTRVDNPRSFFFHKHEFQFPPWYRLPRPLVPLRHVILHYILSTSPTSFSLCRIFRVIVDVVKVVFKSQHRLRGAAR